MLLSVIKTKANSLSKLPKNACAYPFKSAMLMHGVDATPCCRFHNRFLGEGDRQHVDTFDASFADIRETMMRNEWHPGCFKCKADEETKGSSMRTEADEFFSDFTDDVKLEYLEITVGRLCNLKCMSCGPDFSHTWDDDSIKLKMETAETIKKLKSKQELDLDDINVDMLRDLRYIKVTGGEPFLHRQFLNFVVRLADAGLAPNIQIEIFTNCTWWPKKTDYNALLQFKHITISASIDAYGGVNDALRAPSKWEQVEATLDKWIAMRSEYPGKVTVKTATTVNVVNAAYMFEFVYWAKIVKDIDVILQTVYEPHYLSIQHWPDWFKKKLEFTIRMQFSDQIKPGKMRPLRDLLYGICKPNGVEDNSTDYMKDIRQVLRIRDQLDTSWPELRKFKDLVELDVPSINWD